MVGYSCAGVWTPVEAGVTLGERDMSRSSSASSATGDGSQSVIVVAAVSNMHRHATERICVVEASMGIFGQGQPRQNRLQTRVKQLAWRKICICRLCKLRDTAVWSKHAARRCRSPSWTSALVSSGGGKVGRASVLGPSWALLAVLLSLADGCSHCGCRIGRRSSSSAISRLWGRGHRVSLPVAPNHTRVVVLASDNVGSGTLLGKVDGVGRLSQQLLGRLAGARARLASPGRGRGRHGSRYSRMVLGCPGCCGAGCELQQPLDGLLRALPCLSPAFAVCVSAAKSLQRRSRIPSITNWNMK